MRRYSVTFVLALSTLLFASILSAQQTSTAAPTTAAPSSINIDFQTFVSSGSIAAVEGGNQSTIGFHCCPVTSRTESVG